MPVGARASHGEWRLRSFQIGAVPLVNRYLERLRLIERDLRQALKRVAAQASPSKRRWEGAVEVYPEGRRTRRPTARHILDLLEHLRRTDLLQANQTDDDEPIMFYDTLSPAQQRLLTLLGIDPGNYGR